jgi:inner membrane protein involved in colicin E2 resistance
VLVFALIAAAMVMTRKVDWYSLRTDQQPVNTSRSG